MVGWVLVCVYERSDTWVGVGPMLRSPDGVWVEARTSLGRSSDFRFRIGRLLDGSGYGGALEAAAPRVSSEDAHKGFSQGIKWC